MTEPDPCGLPDIALMVSQGLAIPTDTSREPITNFPNYMIPEEVRSALDWFVKRSAEYGDHDATTYFVGSVQLYKEEVEGGPVFSIDLRQPITSPRPRD